MLHLLKITVVVRVTEQLSKVLWWCWGGVLKVKLVITLL